MIYWCKKCRKEFYGIRNKKNRCFFCGGRLANANNPKRLPERPMRENNNQYRKPYKKFYKPNYPGKDNQRSNQYDTNKREKS